jgi:hypothetical protein
MKSLEKMYNILSNFNRKYENSSKHFTKLSDNTIYINKDNIINIDVPKKFQITYYYNTKNNSCINYEECKYIYIFYYKLIYIKKSYNFIFGKRFLKKSAQKSSF